MKVISKEAAKKEFAELTGRQLDHSWGNYKRLFKEATPDLDELVQGEVVFVEIERGEGAAKAFRNQLSEGFKLRSRQKDGGGYNIAIFRYPDSREIASNVREKIREEWGTLR